MIFGTPFVYARRTDVVTPTWSLTAGVQDSGYPVTNIGDFTDLTIGFPGKVTGTTGTWLGDFTSATRVDGIMLWSNLDGALSGVRVQMNATNSWGSPTVNALVVPLVVREDGYFPKLWVDLTAVSGYSTGGFRYIRITVPNANSVAIGIKVLCIGHKRTLNSDFAIDTQRMLTRDRIVLETAFKYRWSYGTFASPRVLVGRLELLDDASRLDVLSWWHSSAGNPVLLVPDAWLTEAWLVWWMTGGASSSAVPNGLETISIDPRRRTATHNPVTLSFVEVSGGGPEWS